MHPEAAQAFVGQIGRLAPHLPGPAGIFNAYGRVYIDINQHGEFAARETASPYELATVLGQIEELASLALRRLKQTGTRLVLANINHNGLITTSAAVWGAHENLLVERHPSTFAEQILPFLATRIYAGAKFTMRFTRSKSRRGRFADETASIQNVQARAPLRPVGAEWHGRP